MCYGQLPNVDFECHGSSINETIDPVTIVTAYFDDEVKDL